MSSSPILIVGTGIGGLTTANALRHQGFEIEIYERAPDLRPAGTGLTVQANAVRTLSRWRGTAELGRQTIDASDIPDLFEMWGHGTRLGGVRIDPERVYWFAVRNAPPRTSDEPASRKARLIEIFRV